MTEPLSRRPPRGRLAVALALLLLVLTPVMAPTLGALEGQVTWRDFVVTGGLSSEGYQGNLPAVGTPVRDSTEFASAIVGEFGLRGDLAARFGESGRGNLSFDGGLRQFSARGFELRDYAPRELSGTVELGYTQLLTETTALGARMRLRGRDVSDRPPMPLFLQPGYRAVSGALLGEYTDGGERRWDVELHGEWSQFLAPAFAPQIRLLDREGTGVELGVRPNWDMGGEIRIHLGGDLARFPQQETFLDEDPFRRDRTLNGGVSWTWSGPVLAQVVGEGRINRSNSRRPEYDSGTLRGLVSASLPGDVAMTGYLALTAKRYRFPTEFARLIPGEEANSASQAYLSFNRPLASNLDGTVRLGWTRAETEIGGQYFQRFGASFLLNYRPGF